MILMCGGVGCRQGLSGFSAAWFIGSGPTADSPNHGWSGFEEVTCATPDVEAQSAVDASSRPVGESRSSRSRSPVRGRYGRSPSGR